MFTHTGVNELSPADYVSLDSRELEQDKIYKYSVADAFGDGTNYGGNAVSPTIRLLGGVSSTDFGFNAGGAASGIGIGNYGSPADPGNGTQFVYVMYDGTNLIWGTTLNGAQTTITDGTTI